MAGSTGGTHRKITKLNKILNILQHICQIYLLYIRNVLLCIQSVYANYTMQTQYLPFHFLFSLQTLKICWYISLHINHFKMFICMYVIVPLCQSQIKSLCSCSTINALIFKDQYRINLYF